MKKIISVILLLCALLSLTACGSEYEPVPSTDEEKRVLMTFELEGEKYELKYELYRALFLNHSEEYDGGNKEFWNTPEANAAKEAIDAKIINLALDIFSALHLSKKIGYDPYSLDADDKIEEYIRQSVEGEGVLGFNGDYDAYLASLKELNMNYSVQALAYRYAIAYAKIVEHYRGTADIDNPSLDMKEGALEYTDDDVRAFYSGDASARISTIIFNADYISHDEVQKRRDKIASYTTESAALGYAVQFTDPMGDPEEILRGTVVGRYSMDTAIYAEVTANAFELNEGETSAVITVNESGRKEYWIVYKMTKSADHLEAEFDTVEEAYISHRIGEIVEGAKAALSTSVKFTDEYRSLNYAEISMN